MICSAINIHLCSEHRLSSTGSPWESKTQLERKITKKFQRRLSWWCWQKICNNDDDDDKEADDDHDDDDDDEEADDDYDDFVDSRAITSQKESCLSEFLPLAEMLTNLEM